jgi:hypothetical protein
MACEHVRFSTVSAARIFIHNINRALHPMICLRSVCVLLLLTTACNAQAPSRRDSGEKGKGWILGPFQKQDSVNPILSPLTATTFACPVLGTDVRWEGKYVFNPAAIVKDGKVCLLYRAEDGFWGDRSTSRIGLAWSDDAIHFQKRTEPVLFPDGGAQMVYEWPGGCKDPRIVEDGRGGFVLTYTA